MSSGSLHSRKFWILSGGLCFSVGELLRSCVLLGEGKTICPHNPEGFGYLTG